MQTWAQVCSRGADVSLTDVKIKIPGQGDVNDVMHRKRARRILGDLRKVSWVLRSEEEGWLSLARSGLVAGATRVGGGWGRKIVPLSLSLCRKTFKLKGYKKFRTWTKCFSCFGIPMYYVYMLWTFYVRFSYSCMGMLHLSGWRTNKPSFQAVDRLGHLGYCNSKLRLVNLHVWDSLIRCCIPAASCHT